MGRRVFSFVCSPTLIWHLKDLSQVLISRLAVSLRYHVLLIITRFFLTSRLPVRKNKKNNSDNLKLMTNTQFTVDNTYDISMHNSITTSSPKRSALYIYHKLTNRPCTHPIRHDSLWIHASQFPPTLLGKVKKILTFKKT